MQKTPVILSILVVLILFSSTSFQAQDTGDNSAPAQSAREAPAENEEKPGTEKTGEQSAEVTEAEEEAEDPQENDQETGDEAEAERPDRINVEAYAPERPDNLPEVYVAGEEGVDFIEGDIMIISMQEVIDNPTKVFLRRMLKQAERMEAGAFIIDMDTPGGRVDVTLDILKMLNRTDVPTYTYVNPNAASAGSLISIGTDHIYMAPISAMGAAAVVSSAGDLPETVAEKATSYLTALVRDTARAKGHNPELAEAFINKDVEVKIGDTLISAKGSLLTLSAEEATQRIDGKKVLAEAIVEDIPHLAHEAELTGQLIRFEKTGFEKIGTWLAALAPILLLIGIAGAYLEFQMPGFGVPGMISIIAFGLFFFGHHVVGLAGYELAAVFVLGVVFLVIELFILPGFFIFGLLGLCMMVGAAFFAMADIWPADFVPQITDLSVLMPPLINLLIAIAGASVIAALAAIYLPKSPIFRRLALNESVGGLTPAPVEGVSIGSAEQPLETGETGEAIQHLRPVGKAAFREGEIIRDVISAGQWIERGTRVCITQVSGSRVLVEPETTDGDTDEPA